MSLKGIVFDFNGTLFWDSEIHNHSWDIFLKKYGMSLSNEEKIEKIHGKNNRDILYTLFSTQLSKEEIEKFSIEKEIIYQKLCMQTDMQLAPGAFDFLDFLRNANIPFTIATASVIENVEFYFEHLGLDTFFDISEIIYNNGSILSKPDPQIYHMAFELLGLKASETLVFEDSVAGIIAAENAGAAKIIIVNSNDDDYSRWNFQIIKDFAEVDKNLFNQGLTKK
jgi:beta-phosphoglucomutase